MLKMPETSKSAYDFLPQLPNREHCAAAAATAAVAAAAATAKTPHQGEGLAWHSLLRIFFRLVAQKQATEQ